VNTAYVWILAPVSHAKSGELQIGYSGAFQNASASRFVLAKPGQPFTPGDPRFDASGRYVPYYTPENQIAHAALTAAMLRLTSTATVRVNGSYALHASEDAPTFVAAGGPSPQQSALQRTTVRRTFAPWSAHGVVELAATPATSISATGDFARTAFYGAGSVGVQVSHRFDLTRRRAAADY